MTETSPPPLYLLDANACNARQSIPALNELERLAEEGLIQLCYTYVTWDEAQRGSVMRRIKVDDFFYLGLASDDENKLIQEQWRKKIENIVFPFHEKSESQRADIEALLIVKMAGGCFVTRDGGSTTQPGGILGHRDKLALLGIEVVGFDEALRRATSGQS
jgi:hypothetical protein